MKLVAIVVCMLCLCILPMCTNIEHIQMNVFDSLVAQERLSLVLGNSHFVPTEPGCSRNVKN